MSSHKFFEIESSNLYKFENLNKKKINYISHKSKKQNIFNCDFECFFTTLLWCDTYV